MDNMLVLSENPNTKSAKERYLSFDFMEFSQMWTRPHDTIVLAYLSP
jgi:hypothetical protein